MAYRIALIGCGTVGQGFLEILNEKEKFLKKNYDFEAKIVGICDKLKGSIIEPEGIDLDKLLDILKRGERIENYRKEEAGKIEAEYFIDNVEADIMVEVTYTNLQTGEPATAYIKKAIQKGCHVVTSNKGPVALHYHELKKLAEKNNVYFKFEGTVMSGSPIFNLVESSFKGNEILEIRGILNGTTNFILTKMEEGLEYEQALKLAQELGYAEADPTADVEGYDAVAKIVILSNVLFDGKIKPQEVEREGITGISKEDVLNAKEMGYRYKLIASAKKENGEIIASVKPERIPLTEPLANITDIINALCFKLDLLGEVIIQGPGAGRKETGYAILSDILNIHFNILKEERR
ncbi:homoserine dehydrogenase [Candidatus Aminicenantes bacterium AC-335-A11]|jgi:homoserine dehydrogenase|nr:homoserine dehydrogenase [SCandidatus Aminicenantes bacterium Aminicenantia_JdfR_composite]MCP2597336.1 homoserine dehydrogenase [Candidatus Aminicenantes bacterium AC-335-G13]MCP2606432.1 homoserine dehydrogenase [Candidatus Aminicenantes bacterium AC-708-I09]MCP2618873.1 homoserine dehydrogenase [Candidatus Aminicenantes bacterium AC-335-A11]